MSFFSGETKLSVISYYGGDSGGKKDKKKPFF